MGNIRVLPEAIANKIAAGEVIERPASIVKELIENSLDAGAESIEVAIRHGGKSLIRVADDGSGMAPDDAELAFQRHATSKIISEQDLERIASYGFRGEALASIAAVSRVKMVTRPANEDQGTEVSIEGGRFLEVKPAAGKPGTVLEIRDLFFNTPARRKFLRSDTTEAGHVETAIMQMALSRPDVHFIFRSQDKVIFELLPGVSLEERMNTFFGPEISKHVIRIEKEAEGIKISGCIGKPVLARANRTGQSFFINKRWIRSSSLSYAVQAGYHGLLMHGLYPIFVLSLDMDPSAVDVNVHPTKQEVRISGEAKIKAFIQQAVSEALSAEPALAPLIQPALRGMVMEPQVSIYAEPNAQEPSAVMEKFTGTAQEMTLPFQKQSEEFGETLSIRDRYHITKILGQIHHTFIVAETREGMLILDQHAAHERVHFEGLCRAFKSGQPSVQRLLLDEIFKVGAVVSDIIRQHMGFLQKIGFEIDDFGEHTFIVRAVPHILSQENAEVLIRQFAEEIEEGKVRSGLEDYEEEAAALIACKRKSVKAHDVISPSSVKFLLKQLSECDNPFSCPHGRPVFLNYTFYELEKQFKRKI